ncbi:nuclease [Intrasporangium chromatireducens Q5-1]|uniref:Nuclease n=1 Tax=Intrasporangium chromatireducens Q5-1 TaxID=584657 RepID=W9GJL7_9MICO|nr:NERD domain-containing protein [Intrasporangium chromatireducens]EWT04059.1 nuclease [Intrasporangium chromatireducens Q5-1]
MGHLGERPRFEYESERIVWERLERTVPADTDLIANLRLTTQKKDHELDIIVLMPGAGIVVVEVKGGSVSVDEDGRWWTSGEKRKSRSRVRPVEQARDGKYALRDYVERDARWRESSRSRVRWGHMVVLPFTDLADDFATPDCPRWAISGRGDLDDLAERIREVVVRQESGHRVPTEDDIELIEEILTGRHLPTRGVSAEADEREAVADRLTQEQATLLNAARLIHRLEVRGGAGSGKTILALTQAKELTRGRGGRRPQRVALVCYSIGLSEYFKRQLAVVPRKERPAFVGCFEDLAREWGITEFPERNDTEFWEHGLAARMAELAAQLPQGKRFDSVIVDEAQDFADDWWLSLMRALKDEETGGLYVYSDENQRVFSRFGKPPVPLVPLVLDHNLRNTRQIATAFGPLTPMRMTLRGGDGPDVEFRPCETDDALGVADDEVDRLLDEGWQPRDVALLTLGSRHPIQKERWDAEGQTGYWRSFWENDDVFYGHVLGCKGLERRAVVLCANAKPDLERATEMLYVGMSRATDRLVIVGDPMLIREIGGDQVAARLGLS